MPEAIYKYFVAVKFDGTLKPYYFSTNIEDLKQGDKVVVETISGLELGTVASPLMSTAAYESDLVLKPILRKPTKEDLSDYKAGLKDAKMALDLTRNEVEKLGLGMNLIDAYFTLDGSKVTITYTADDRVDFRDLLKILAPTLGCRVELRQIAPRDKAKMVGGMGLCGLPLCCSTFLNQFDRIQISRAKNQMLSLNTAKLSGACGMLMCCLLFEDDMYTEAKRDFPAIKTVVHVNKEDYTVQGFNILSRTVKLSDKDGNISFVTLEEFNKMAKPDRPERKFDNRNNHHHHNHQKGNNRQDD